MYDNSRPVLGIVKSANQCVWKERLDTAGLGRAEAINRNFDISDILSRVLAAKDIDPDKANAYLDPSMRDLMPDPSSLTDMDNAVERLSRAINDNEKIAIFGDYDVDGATSSALMHLFLKSCDIQSTIYIPDRIYDGYGPNIKAMDLLIDQGHTLILTLDCGSTSFEALKHTSSRKIDVVVLDHHQVGEELPECCALVNPNRQDDLSGLGYCAAVGVVFMTIVALNRHLRKAGFWNNRTAPDLLSWLDLVALGTVADVVPLTGLNRAFVHKGLIAIRGRTNPGLAALQTVARLSGPAAAYHLGFLLGPRINAGGRIGDAALGARLLTTTSPEDATRIAAELDVLNQQRQQKEAIMLEEATELAERQIIEQADTPVLIVSGEEWHPGIVGLLASRLKEKFKRPSIAFSINADNTATGSGRSIPGIDLGACIRQAVDENILVKGGGHAMAAGMTISVGQIATLRSFLENALHSDVARMNKNPELRIDAPLTASGATEELIQDLEKAGPYGSGQPDPIFVFPSHNLRFVDTVGNGHIRCSLSDGMGKTIKGIAFRAAEEPLGKLMLGSRMENLHVAGSLSLNYWRGKPEVQLRIVDAAKPLRN
ncbi:MAG: single-stranded-DNA-specific exonuclease RecJ [Cohaesibacteraceae bacterium]|nr:single-stranded-DNA-specific exonuclease RecJ [Cohaesibacteraceae bacterium]